MDMDGGHWWRRAWKTKLDDFRGTLWICVVLWAMSVFIIFIGWGVGSDNIEVGNGDTNHIAPGHPLAGQIIEGIGVVIMIAVAIFTIFVVAKGVRDRRG
jgi:hypothetical protein